MIDYFRLSQVIFGQMIAPQGQAIGPAGVEPPAGARNRRKAAVKKNEESPLKEVCHEWDYTQVI